MNTRSDQPLISIIIPVFNLEEYLGEALDSVLNQTYQPIEILVIDDGSSDASRQIIETYHRKFPRCIRYLFQENKGAAAARNRGIELANGEWIAFLDGDDVWKPHKLERQFQELQAAPEIDFLSSSAEIYGHSGVLKNHVPTLSDVKCELLLNGCFIILSTAIIRTALLREERFNEMLPAAHDFELFLRLVERCRYSFLAESLAYYRIRNDSLTAIEQRRYLQTSMHYRFLLREAENFTGMTVFYKKKFKQARRRLSHEAAYAALMSSHISTVKRIFMVMTAIKEHPSNLKNYRFLIQSMLPAKINTALSRLLRRTIQ